jgi:hypothetical protein
MDGLWPRAVSRGIAPLADIPDREGGDGGPELVIRGEHPVIVACLGNPDPVGMKVYAPSGEETFDDVQTTEEAQAGADRRQAA